MTVALYILDIAEFSPIAGVAAKDPSVRVLKRGPYFEVSCDKGFEVDRADTGCRNAIWYSSVAAVRDGRVARWDKDVLRVEPASGVVLWPGPHEGIGVER